MDGVGGLVVMMFLCFDWVMKGKLRMLLVKIIEITQKDLILLTSFKSLQFKLQVKMNFMPSFYTLL